MTRHRVMLVANDVGGPGGMELVFEKLLRGTCATIDYTVVSATLAPSLRPLCRWVRVPAPKRPAPLRSLVFVTLGTVIVWFIRTRQKCLVHVMGGLVLNRADVATIPFLHAEFYSLQSHRGTQRSLLKRSNSRLHKAMSTYLERRLLRGRCHVALCPSPGLAQSLQAIYPGCPVSVVPHGVDHERFKPDLEVRKRKRAELGVGDDETVVIFVGGDWPRKGVENLLRAVVTPNVIIGLRIWIVGDGDETLADPFRAALGPQLELWGRRLNPEAWLASADIFCFPSAYETFGLAAYEAAACGLPLVASSVHGVTDLLVAGGGVAAQSVTELREAIYGLSASKERRLHMGELARETSLAFTWERANAATLDHYAFNSRGTHS